MMYIHIEHASYEEQRPIIENLQFTLPKGQLIGLIGANGAGKSTTIQTMIGTVPFAKGTFDLPRFGYVPERPVLYEHFTLREHIEFLIETVEQNKSDLQERAMELCQLFRLHESLDVLPTTFSKGMQQKVMLILAFTPRYDFYIVDEPFMGLDPQAMRRFIALLEKVKRDGATILMSTHALHTAEHICDQFILLHEGKLLQQGTLEQLQSGRNIPLLDIFDMMIEGEL